MIRKIHLDFHTSPLAENIGEKFNAEEFAQTLSNAKVNYLVVPGKCHYGMSYFKDSLGSTHPHLRNTNLFADIVAACKKNGISVQAYYSLGIDNFMIKKHPEWRQQREDGGCPSWGTICDPICFASPYIDEVVLHQIDEIIDQAPGISGFWFDICLYEKDAYYSKYFEQKAVEELGANAGNKERKSLALKILNETAQKLNKHIKKKIPDAENYYNSLVTPMNKASIDCQEICEIEAPPFFWGYDYYPSASRCIRATDKKMLGLTSRFQQPWEDMGALRTHDQILYDTAAILASGADISIGDHLHPSGQLDKIVYETIGKIYNYATQLEPYLKDVFPVAEVAVLSNSIKTNCGTLDEISELTRTAVRVLAENSIQCDVVTEKSDFSNYKLILWTGEEQGSPELVQKLKSHVHNGGALLAANQAIIGLEECFGAVHKGYYMQNGCFIKLCEDGMPKGFAQGLRLRQINVEVLSANILANLYDSTTNQAVNGNLGWIVPAAAEKVVGAGIIQSGRCIYFAASVFEDYQKEGTAFLRKMIIDCADKLLGDREITHSAGVTVEATLHKGESSNMIHLVQWATERWNEKQCYAAEAPSLGPIDVSLKSEKEPVKVEIVPNRTELNWTYENGRTHFTISGMKVHCAISIEFSKRGK